MTLVKTAVLPSSFSGPMTIGRYLKLCRNTDRSKRDPNQSILSALARTQIFFGDRVTIKRSRHGLSPGVEPVTYRCVLRILSAVLSDPGTLSQPNATHSLLISVRVCCTAAITLIPTSQMTLLAPKCINCGAKLTPGAGVIVCCEGPDCDDIGL